MHFDDRLATVLRQNPSDSGANSRDNGSRAERTQYRQLLDLLGRRKPVRGRQLAAAAWLRLDSLAASIPVADRARIVAEGGSQLSSPELVTNLANDEPEVAAAALQRARLSEDDWEALIPRLPVRARGFLRFRNDLPERTKRSLERLGVHDRGLPSPGLTAVVQTKAPTLPRPADTPGAPDLTKQDASAAVEASLRSPQPPEGSEIGQLVKRIEAFQLARTVPPGDGPQSGGEAPRLPLGDKSATKERTPIAAFDFTCDSSGLIDWADGAAAPLVEGALLAGKDGAALPLLRQARPLSGAAVTLDGAPIIAGEWVVSAAPRFGPGGGFRGYAGIFRRPPSYDTAIFASGLQIENAQESEASRIREVLHELRTPVNAIQGFAEVIQQQLFGPVPHDYRAHAASIAGDAARVLSGFDELDRLARLESGALELAAGESDFAEIIRALLAQMADVLAPRMAGFAADIPAGACIIALARNDAEAIAWRLMATIASTVSAGEEVELALSCDADCLRLRVQLTAVLLDQTNVFSSTARSTTGPLTAGTFGAGFTLRLARAEARATGGDLVAEDDWLTLSLPRLTVTAASPSDRDTRSATGGPDQ